MSPSHRLNFVLQAIKQGHKFASQFIDTAGAFFDVFDSSAEVFIASRPRDGGNGSHNEVCKKDYQYEISDFKPSEPSAETRMAQVSTHRTGDYTPDISHLTHVDIEGEQVPALALTTPVCKSLYTLNVGIRKANEVRTFSAERLAQLLTDIKVINDQLGQTFPSKRVELDESDEIAALRLQRWKKIDEARAMATFNKAYGEEEYQNPASIFDANVWEKLRRAGIVNGREELEVLEHSEDLFQNHLREQSTLPWPESDSDARSPSTEYTESELEEGSQPDVLYRNLEKARARVRTGRASKLGEVAADLVKEKAYQAINGGYVFPPWGTVTQYALLQRTHSLMQFNDATKKYKRLKRRMRKKGLPVKRAFSDDTELSWDGADGEGSDDGANGVLYRRRRARRWWEKLPERMANEDGSESNNTPSVARSSALPSLGFGSGGVSIKEMFDYKYRKRADMWSKLEKSSTREMVKGRSRTEEPSRKLRLNRRKLNDFLVQMPEHFRYTNLTPRHPNGSVQSRDSIESPSDGDFQYWDRPKDPTSDEEQASRNPKRPFEEEESTIPKAKRSR